MTIGKQGDARSVGRVSARSGFSLLELSIVLVIIAVVISGVLVGRTMIMASRLQTVITDSANYISAVGNFKTTYLALPGDFSNAEAMWGIDSGTCSTPNGVAPGTCNGNGDGRVGPFCASSVMDYTKASESFRAWQHLNSSGLVASSLTALSTSGAYTFLPGQNIPSSSIKGGGFNLMWLDDSTQCTNYWGLITGSGRYGNVLLFSATGTNLAPPILTPEQADGIDRKIDDGIPNTGLVRTPNASTVTNCILNPSGYTYNVGYSAGAACTLLFLTNY